MLYNLISNAIKFQFPDRDCIRHHLLAPGGALQIKNNDLGIDSRLQEGLYTMFKRFHDHVEGTGVWLYMVKRILENAGGKIEVKSEAGTGTAFKLYFPAAV
ncbi:ATP-binding protein [Pontibacter chitinilyticus]|uniref:ATP-binding protein n=1 Tax=Pontibacter chitinilyticus TaxID=2674989 RepID=UPI00321BA502